MEEQRRPLNRLVLEVAAPTLLWLESLNRTEPFYQSLALLDV